MSSRRLLVLLDHLPEDSAFKTAIREGDWSFEQYISVGILNEIRLLRTDQAAINGHKMDSALIESPAQMERKQEIGRRNEALRAGILAQLNGENVGGTADNEG